MAVRAPQEREAQIAHAGGAGNWPYHTETPHSASAADISDLCVTSGSSLDTFLKLTKKKALYLFHVGFSRLLRVLLNG